MELQERATALLQKDKGRKEAKKYFSKNETEKIRNITSQAAIEKWPLCHSNIGKINNWIAL